MSLRVVFFGTSSNYSLLPLQRIAADHQLVAVVESGEHKCRKARLSTQDKAIELLYAFTGQPSLWAYAHRHHLPYFYLCPGHEQELAAFLKELSPDIGCIASFNQLLPAKIIQIPRQGIINFHPTLLPKYRGPNVWFWLYHEMERESGATIHYIDEKEDHGDILKQVSFPIRPGMPPQELQDNAIALGSDLFAAALAEIENGTACPAPQAELSGLLRGRSLKPGEDLFPWEQWEIEHVYHFLAGVYPWYRALRARHGLLGLLPWKASGYKRCTVSNPGSLALDRGGVYFAHPQGRVRLQLAVPPEKAAFWLLMVVLLLAVLLTRI